jgi:hypothetical protein
MIDAHGARASAGALALHGVDHFIAAALRLSIYLSNNK